MIIIKTDSGSEIYTLYTLYILMTKPASTITSTYLIV